MRYQIINTWNGGQGGRKIVYRSSGQGTEGQNECFKWFHDNTPFSQHEATANQGYEVEPLFNLTEYRQLVRRTQCRFCGAKLPQTISHYSHAGGFEVDGLDGPQWLYIHCTKCGYDWALAKLGV